VVRPFYSSESYERGYRIEDEHPIPMNDLCSFVAMREMASDAVGKKVAQALNGNRGFHTDGGAI
jgi:hypothetical protein